MTQKVDRLPNGWKGFAPAVRPKTHPYGICHYFDCWKPAVLENVMCERHQGKRGT